MNVLTAAVLAGAIGLVPLSAFAQAAAPMKSERAMPAKNSEMGKQKPKKSERAMSSTAKTKKAKRDSERAMTK